MVPAPPSPAFFCLLFFFSMTSGGWRTIVDISTLNLSVVKLVFSDGVCSNDCLFGAVLRICGFYDLEGLSFRLGISSGSKFLGFLVGGGPGASRISASFCPLRRQFSHGFCSCVRFLLRSGVWILCYLDDWLTLALSLEESC